jgi:hypothetical protein
MPHCSHCVEPVLGLKWVGSVIPFPVCCWILLGNFVAGAGRFSGKVNGAILLGTRTSVSFKAIRTEVEELPWRST